MGNTFHKGLRTAAFFLTGFLLSGHAPAAPLPVAAQTAQAPADAAGTPFSADRLASLLPPSVYFQGRTASLQIRNAGGVSFGDGKILWAALVDTSGYSTAVRDRYQFYFVTESPVRFGSSEVPAGVYGAGFLTGHYVLMDVGGHTVAEGPLQTEAGLRRPRPLQLVSDSATSVKLYLGRSFVVVQASAPR